MAPGKIDRRSGSASKTIELSAGEPLATTKSAFQHRDLADGASIIQQRDILQDSNVFRITSAVIPRIKSSNIEYELHDSQLLLTASPSRLLVSSPYDSTEHLLDLSTLGVQEILLARALSSLEPVRPDYATADYLESFNWDFVFSTLTHLCVDAGHVWKQQAFFTVIFRSQLTTSCDRKRLFLLDERSHYEATLSGGLLKYWFGETDAENRNLATCMSA